MSLRTGSGTPPPTSGLHALASRSLKRGSLARHGARGSRAARALSWLLLPALTLSACRPPGQAGSTPASGPTAHPWGAALRALDAADAADPAQDLTAAYLRPQGPDMEVRVDLLAFDDAGALDLEVRIRAADNPGAQVAALRLPEDLAGGRISVDDVLDTVAFRFPAHDLPAGALVDVLTPQDELRGLRPEGPVPGGTAALLLAFHGTFPARFPAEALRSWDGAHSGPRGERHGLKHLLEAVEAYRVPVVLLDLKAPESLSALEAAGALAQVRRLAEDGLLLLPEGSGAPGAGAGDAFDLPPSSFAYLPGGGDTSLDYQFRFYEPATRLHHWKPSPLEARAALPVPLEPAGEPSRDGLPLEVRGALVQAALQGDPEGLLVLGGDLRTSTWGAAYMAGPALAYLASRPYIRALGAADLAAFPAVRGEPAWLPAPGDEALGALEAHYAGLVEPVLAYAEAWDGAKRVECGLDLDADGAPECALSNEHLLAVLDPAGGRLAYLFARDADGPRMVVGPSWVVASGLSNPALWRPELGEAADPGAYPGAFYEPDAPFLPYGASIEGDSITFASGDGSRIKAFLLNGSTLEARYLASAPLRVRVALLVDPDARFSPGWAGHYALAQDAQELRWGLQGGPVVRLQAPGALDALAFNEHLDLLSGPEDPDFEYPGGYSLPFPMALAEARVEGEGRFLLAVE